MDYVFLFIGLIAGVAVLLMIARGLSDWRLLVTGLLYYMPFSGLFAIASGHNPFSLVAKDVLFLIPMYFSFFLLNAKDIKYAHVPTPVLAAMFFMAAIVLLQCLNPAIPNILIAIVGAKVWLISIPLVPVVGAMLKEQKDHIRLLRIMVGLAIIPATIGLLEWVLAATIGFQAVMDGFYGADESKNIGASALDYGGDFYRIPSTFTAAAQYFSFLLCMMIAAFILKEIDTDWKWRKYGRMAYYYIIVATFLCGARAAFVFVPALMILLNLMDGRVKGMMLGIVVAPLLLFGSLYFAGVDPLLALGDTGKLSSSYGTGFILEGPLTALNTLPFGWGSGMNTNGARYLFPGQILPGSLLPFNIEGYVSKTIVELGAIGLIALFFLFTSIIAAGFHARAQLKDKALRTAASSYTVYISLTALMAFKGWQLDIEPTNVYFWVYVGMLLKLPYLEKATAPKLASRPSPRPAPTYGYRMPPGMVRRLPPRPPR